MNRRLTNKIWPQNVLELSTCAFWRRVPGEAEPARCVLRAAPPRASRGDQSTDVTAEAGEREPALQVISGAMHYEK
jgi:hypothetical protein